MRFGRRGFGLVEILIAAALLAIVMGGFLQFMKSAGKAQTNLAKIAETSSMDMGIRSILANATGCRNTVAGMNLATVGTPPTVYHAVGAGAQTISIRNPFNQVVYQAGTVANGIRIAGIEAYASAPVNGVYFVQLHVRTDKEGAATGDRIGRIDYDYRYFMNVIAPGGVVDRCFSTPNDVAGTMTLLGTEAIALMPSSAAPAAGNLAIIARPAGPYPWGGAPTYHNHEHFGPNPGNCAPFSAPLCAQHAGPLTTPFRALGNRISFSFNVQMGAVSVSSPGYAFGVGVVAVLRQVAGPVLANAGIGAISYGSASGGDFQGGTVQGPTSVIAVIPNQMYQFNLLTYLGGETTGGVGPYAGTSSRATGQIFHYLEIP